VRRAACALLSAAVAFAAVAGRSADRGVSAGDALLRLLNSRDANSPQMYAEAAAAVAQDAAEGGIVQQFLLAALQDSPSLPRRARLTSETRRRYMERARPRIEEMAHKRDNPMAWYLLAIADDDMAKLRRAADLGNIQAMNALGAAKMATSPGESVELFRKTAGKGDANGLFNLGECLSSGDGCAKDERAAFECFVKAAAGRHPGAMNELGRFYREGIAVKRDPGRAVAFFAKSAGMGNSFGQLNYAMALLAGEGVAKDAPRALALLESAARKGNAAAMEALSQCYADGAGGLEPDSKLAATWLVRSRAAKGDAAAKKWLEANEGSVQ